MIITIASGKGGTGKTTLAVNLARALQDENYDVRLLDCDVEEPNDYLFIKPNFTSEEDVKVLKPVWDEEKCQGCEECVKACSYNALAKTPERLLIFNELCHSCGACSYVCPYGAIREVPTSIGKVQVCDEDSSLFFAHGILSVGESLAPKVVKAVKQHVGETSINIIDASPGVACPVVEAVDGSDVVLLVTEPTLFGLHDLKFAVSLTKKMGIPAGIVVNRSDGIDTLIADYAEDAQVPIVGRIPFKRAYAEEYSKGGILVDSFPSLKEQFMGIYDQARALVGKKVVEDVPEELAVVSNDYSNNFDKGSSSDYKEVMVVSGKGGTGKTTVSASLAALASDHVLEDCDVDAADLHLLLKPRVLEKNLFYGGSIASIDPKKCIGCGKCALNCHFDAIDKVEGAYRVNEIACEGCNLCKNVCPADAITVTRKITGQWFVSDTAKASLVHACLGVAEENSGKLVSQVRDRAMDIAKTYNKKSILGDGPPGTSCPVIASITGVDFVIIVTEPTVSGIHDMKRVMELLEHFRVPAGVVVNKADINSEQTALIYKIVDDHQDISILAEIPFDTNVYDALIEGQTVIEWGKGPAPAIMQQLWSDLRIRLGL
ncbi:MAG: ATP-binding protein [Chlamydiota bacterium]